MTPGAQIIDLAMALGASQPTRVIPYGVVCSSDDAELWLAARKCGIGASEIAAAMGESRWSSALKLYCEKRDIMESDDLGDNEAVFWGHELEGTILRVFAKRSGLQVERAGQLLQSIAHPWALCTLDGWVTDATTGERFPVEAKNAHFMKAKEWAGGPSGEYAIQVQQQLLVTGASKAYAACLLGGQRLVWCVVERDPIMIRRIEHQGAEFWRRVVEADPPPPDASDSASEAIEALYATRDDREPFMFDGSFMDLDDELGVIKSRLKADENRKTQIQNEIKFALGSRERGLLANGVSYAWPTIHRKSYTVEASTYRQLKRTQPKGH